MKKMLTNDRFLLIVTILSVAGNILRSGFLFVISNGSSSASIINIIVAACIAVLYLSYKNHNKNVMKGMMSAVLMAILIGDITYLTTPASSFDKIFSLLFVLCALALFVNHFLINADRKASPVNVSFNQIVGVLYMILTVIWSVLWIPVSAGTPELISNIICLIAVPCTIAVILSVESRLDAFREDREKAGWTEGKGYPADYDRTKNYSKTKKK